MSKIRPFQAIRPKKLLAERIAALPYDVLNAAEAKLLVRDNPFSFLHVDKAEIDLEEGLNPYDDRVYQKAKENLEKMIRDGILINDSKPCFYIYRLTRHGVDQTGLVASTSIDEYLTGKIKKHELTREEKEQDRIRHVDVCNANTGPIFLAYRGRIEIDQVLNTWIKEHSPVTDFLSEDGIAHSVWVIDDSEAIKRLEKEFESVPALYIADGHHRNASSVKVGLKRRAEHPHYTGEEEFNFTLSVLFNSECLHILDYNRVVKDLKGLHVQEFLKKLEDKFFVEFVGQSEKKPSSVHEFGMYLDGNWYGLKKKKIEDNLDITEKLDVSILQNDILGPILGIGDPRLDKRIDFVGGIRGLDELKKRVDSKEMAVAFALYPTSIDELIQIADEGKIMPPKSTWFEPKLRSGLFIHKLD